MNTHRENYTTTVRQTLTEISADLSQQDIDKKIAANNYSNANEVQIAAENQYDTSVTNCGQSLEIFKQGMDCANTATNLLGTTQTTVDGVASLRTDVGTTATSIAVAVKAISQLSANMGSAQNIAEATMEGTQLYKDTEEANKQIRTAAKKAKEAAFEVVKASSKTAQIAAAKVHDEVTVTHAKFDEMAQKNQAQLAELNQFSSVAHQQTIEAATELKAAKGECENAEAIYQATDTSLAAINKSLNYNLKVQDPNVDGIEVSFDSFTLKGTDDYEHNYHIFVVKAELKDTITMTQVESIFNSDEEERFKTIEKDETDNSYHSNILSTKEGAHNWLLDIEGEKIELGKPYVVFLYIKLNENYKNAINSYYDLLSAPSNEFTLFNILPIISFEGLDNSEALKGTISEKGTVIKTFKFKSNLTLPTTQLHMAVVWLPRKDIANWASILLDRINTDTNPADCKKIFTKLNHVESKGEYSAEIIGEDLYDVFGRKIEFKSLISNLLPVEKENYIPVILAYVYKVHDMGILYQARLSERPDESINFKDHNHKYYVEVDIGESSEPNRELKVTGKLEVSDETGIKAIVTKDEGEAVEVTDADGNPIFLKGSTQASNLVKNLQSNETASPNTGNVKVKKGKRGNK
jgi:hypothetical protein